MLGDAVNIDLKEREDSFSDKAQDFPAIRGYGYFRHFEIVV